MYIKFLFKFCILENPCENTKQQHIIILLKKQQKILLQIIIQSERFVVEKRNTKNMIYTINEIRKYFLGVWFFTFIGGKRDCG